MLLIFFGDTAIVLGPLSGSNLPLGADGGPVQSDTLHDMARPTLPDLLRPGLRLLVCVTSRWPRLCCAVRRARKYSGTCSTK